MRYLSILFISALLCSCSTSIRTKVSGTNHNPLADSTKVYIVENVRQLPEATELVGTVKIGDSGFTTRCDYETVITDFENAARKVGANIIMVTEVKTPTSLGSTCYRIQGKAFRNLNTEHLKDLRFSDSNVYAKKIEGDPDYAIVHFYRPTGGPGHLLGYKVKDEKSQNIGRMRTGETFSYKTTAYGERIFKGSLETTEEVKLTLEKGHEYYVKCSVGFGIMLGRPIIKQMRVDIGKEEFKILYQKQKSK